MKVFVEDGSLFIA